MSTDLVAVSPANAVIPAMSQDLTGMSDIGIKPGTLTLVQNTTRDPKTARPGQILDSISEEVYDSVVIVPMRVWKQRVYFPQGAGLDVEPICRSNDGIVPDPRSNVVQAANCRSCPKAQWYNGKKSECAEKWRMLTIKKDTGLPRYVNFTGKSISALKMLLQRIQEYRIEARNKQGLNLELFDFFFTLTLERETNNRGTYFVTRFKDLMRVKNVAEFGPLFQEFVIRARQQWEEEEPKTEIQVATEGVVNDVVNAEYVDV